MRYPDVVIPETVIIDDVTGYTINIPLGDQVPPGWQENHQDDVLRIRKLREQYEISIGDDKFQPSPFTGKISDALQDAIEKQGNLGMLAEIRARVNRDREIGFLKSRKKELLTKLDEIIEDIEEKGIIRHVRTEAGVRKYGQPIGSVIVADSPKAPGFRLTNINFRQRFKRGDDGKFLKDGSGNKIPEDDGYDLYVGANGQNYWVYSNKDGWYAVDDDNEIQHYGETEEQLLVEIDEWAANPGASSNRGRRGSPDTWGGNLGPNWRPIKSDDILKGLPDKHPLKDGAMLRIAPAWVDVWINTDPDGEPVAIGFDGADRMQRLYSSEHHMKQAALKQKRIEALHKYIKKLDAAIKSGWRTDDNAKAVMLMRRMGMRPGSTTDTRAVLQAFGATTLEARHVTVNKDSITFDFIGKKGKRIHLNTRDPEIYEMIKAAKGTKQGRDRLFPNATSAKATEYMDQYLPPGQFSSKDLRTYRATEVALDAISKVKKQPTTRAEFVKWRNAIGDLVAAELGNTRTLALKSYINPTLFDAISKNNPEWSAEFARQILGGDDGE